MPLYSDGQEVKEGDIFKSARPELDNDTWLVLFIDPFHIGWKHMNTGSIGKKPFIHQTSWTLISRADSKSRRSGFSKFIRRIEA